MEYWFKQLQESMGRYPERRNTTKILLKQRLTPYINQLINFEQCFISFYDQSLRYWLHLNAINTPASNKDKFKDSFFRVEKSQTFLYLPNSNRLIYGRTLSISRIPSSTVMVDWYPSFLILA